MRYSIASRHIFSCGVSGRRCFAGTTLIIGHTGGHTSTDGGGPFQVIGPVQARGLGATASRLLPNHRCQNGHRQVIQAATALQSVTPRQRRRRNAQDEPQVLGKLRVCERLSNHQVSGRTDQHCPSGLRITFLFGHSEGRSIARGYPMEWDKPPRRDPRFRPRTGRIPQSMRIARNGGTISPLFLDFGQTQIFRVIAQVLCPSAM
jgi:hypothetical protein